jgi:hypothetical protein
MAGKKKPANLPSPAVIQAMRERIEELERQQAAPVKTYDAWQGEKYPSNFPPSMPHPTVKQFREPAPPPPSIEYPLKARLKVPTKLDDGRTLMTEQEFPAIGPLQEREREAYDRAMRNLYLDMTEVKGNVF